MRATGINHVSVSAPDLEASIRFYTEVFGMERVPAPNVEVNWPDASILDRSVVTDIDRLADTVPQDAEGLAARLYTDRSGRPAEERLGQG